ncbi:MAG: hypothetical protein OSJ45_10335 [Lachnospiraceae bacterium]|nr:hypothetical protein [Lachnospiraceae bacterium]
MSLHSTTYENGKGILEDGYIGSWNLLKKERKITDCSNGKTVWKDNYGYK